MIIALRILLFALSTFGYVFIASYFLKLDWRPTVLLAFTFKSIVIFLFALINYLQLGMYFTFVVGIALFICSLHLISTKKINIFKYITKNDLVFFVFLFALYIFFPRDISLMTASDNYSHWATIVKHLYDFESLPNLVDGTGIVTFLSYPPGTGIFINYFLQFVGFGTRQILLGQAILICSSYLAITSIAQQKKYLTHSLLGIFMIALFHTINLHVGFENVYVDYIMPVIGLALIVILWLYRERPWLSGMHLIVIGGYLSLIKNTGLLFMIIGIVYFLYNTFVLLKGEYFKKGTSSIVALVLTFVPYLLWTNHSEELMGNNIAKHTMNIDNFEQVFNDKSPEVVSEIVENFIFNFLDFTNSNTIHLIYIFGMMFMVFTSLYLLTSNKTLWKIYFSGLIISIVYYFGLLLMYLLSMPTNEAILLASFGRYAMTINIYIVGLFSIGIITTLKSIPKISPKPNRWLNPLIILAIASIIIFDYVNIRYLNFDSNNFAYRLQETIEERIVYNEDNYLIVFSDEENTSGWYLRYVSKYYFHTPNVTIFSTDSQNVNSNEIDDFDYIVILDRQDESLQAIEQLSLDEDVSVGVHNVSEMN